jgi:ribosomal subunit interface protein
MQVTIRGHQTDVQARWKDHINDRLAKLERFEDRIIKIDVTLTSDHHHLKGNEECKFTVKVPRKTINVTKNAETMIGAIDAASKTLEQQIHALYKDIKDRNRHAVQPRTLNGASA